MFYQSDIDGTRNNDTFVNVDKIIRVSVITRKKHERIEASTNERKRHLTEIPIYPTQTIKKQYD